jgi:predicted dehydrogenase
VTEPVKLAVIGAGVIGRRHAALIAAEPRARLVGIVDPEPVGRALAQELGASWRASLAELLAADRPDGAIIATPNRLHVENGLEAIAAGLPVIVEKPIADNVAAAERLVAAAAQSNVPLLVGHHRRYNPMIQKAKAIIDSARLGRILAVHASFWAMKPDEYFQAAWRREDGAGPVLLNLIHDIDLLRYLCGDIVAVQALASNAARGFVVEDSAAILLQFANGALGTVTASDGVVSPWSWELTAGENADYPRQDQSCYQIGGALGALTIPQLEFWSNPARRSWREPLVRERIPFVSEDPLKIQIRHFCDVITGRAQPIMPGREGLATLKIVEAIKIAAGKGAVVATDLSLQTRQSGV